MKKIILSGLAVALLALPVKAAVELLPNLKPLAAKDLRIETASDGATYLRFSTTSWNNGLGALELRAGNVDVTNAKREVFQRIYMDDGTFADVKVGDFVWHPDHGHFHFEDYALYTLQPVNAPGASERISSKTTFCIIDTDRVNNKLPGAPKRAQYTTCNSDIQGMSVGWGDTYKYYLSGQAIDITSLPDGDYNLKIEIDPKGRLFETDETDNVSNLAIHIQGGSVSVIGGSPGHGNCPSC